MSADLTAGKCTNEKQLASEIASIGSTVNKTQVSLQLISELNAWQKCAGKNNFRKIIEWTLKSQAAVTVACEVELVSPPTIQAGKTFPDFPRTPAPLSLYHNFFL